MIDINLVRNEPERVTAALLKRLPQINLADLLNWDSERRALIAEADGLKARRNRVSLKIPQMKKRGEDVSSLIGEMKTVSGRIKELDSSRSAIDAKIRKFMESLPNLPDEDVPGGGKENNEVIRSSDGSGTYDFKPKNHVDLVTALGMIDYERGAKLSGAGFWIYRGAGALIEWALLSYFVEQHLADGYEFIFLPHILKYECGYTAGQFPKFAADVFFLNNGDEESSRFLLPTSETALADLHRGEILAEDELPKKYFSLTPCYRREAGSYRTGERGMIRGHQFNKVELFQYCLPEESEKALQELLEKAERLVNGLGLRYRISKLAAGDCSAAAAKTFDIEVWIPSMDDYKEVSSVSNTRDYQARRGGMRFKRKDSGQNEFVHTLNASGLATSRLLPAICEQFQQRDGSVVVPEVLRKWTGFDTVRPDTIRPAGPPS